MKRNTAIPFLVLVGFAITMCIIYMFTTEREFQTDRRDEVHIEATDNLATYVNTRFRFQFDYPAHWLVQDEEHLQGEATVCDSVHVHLVQDKRRSATLSDYDSMELVVSAFKDCPYYDVTHQQFLKQPANAILDGLPAWKSALEEGDATWEGPAIREESGITLRTFRNGIEYRITLSPRDTPLVREFHLVTNTFTITD